MEATLNETQLSDLFFNFDKPDLEAAYQLAGEPDMKDYAPGLIQEALIKEADRFADLIDNQVPADWFVENFNKRV